MSGALYFWIMLAVFLGCVGISLLLWIIFRIGHWLEKKETGATHGFLELPTELRAPPKKPDQIP